LDVLKEVGLEDHVYKRPNQLSGGQMQRVAIARALVNNPKILLADEPTGALDTKTSGQIIDLIKKISKGRLVIMVTHNAELAEMHSDRIVKLLDGRVIDDSRPEVMDAESSGKLMTKRTTMSFATALKTSYKNLLTKKGRTLITSLAGSIGIIGIALVLSISGGMNTYVAGLQSDTLAGFPITINQTIREFGPPDIAEPSDLDFPESTIVTGYDSSPDVHTNNISQNFVDYLNAMDSSYYNALTFSKAMAMRLVSITSGGNAKYISNSGGSFFSFSNNFYELPNNPTFILDQYDLLQGSLPDAKDELLLVVDQRNRIDEGFFSTYGINNTEGLDFSDILSDGTNDSVFDLKWIPNNAYFVETDLNGKTIFSGSLNAQGMYDNPDSLPLKITGVVRVKASASAELLTPGLAYTTLLTDYAYADEQVGAVNSDIVQAQEAAKWVSEEEPGYDVFVSGNEFTSEAEYTNRMRTLGGSTLPVGVQIYPSSFENKELIKTYIDAYNYDESGNRIPIEDVIIYSDLAATITSTITDLINTIAIVLAAFASISLFVSSIMIGIITYVSVIERTKEIGIMRSLGARKKDISRIFNAETIIIGFTSGILGITITLLLNIPIDIIIKNFIEVDNFTSLSPLYALGLIVLSTFLTLLAGLIPSGIAAKKDPVIALRTE
jgi:putative ABC transport system permease protein